jgi:Ca2+-binding RTX toxin-like protein
MTPSLLMVNKVMNMNHLRSKALLVLLLASNLAVAVEKVVDGGAGTNSLIMNYSGITSLKDFILSSYSLGELSYIKAVDSGGNEIDFTRINALKVNSISYAFAPSTSINSGDGGISNAFYSTSQKTIHSYGSTVWYAQNICSGSHTLGFNCSDDIEYIGSASQETLNLNIQRGGSNYTGDLTIDLKGGNDSINSAKLINTDSIDMGAGDDTVSVMFGADAGGYQTIQNASISKLDGGSGTDTLSFGESANPPSSISLTTAGATNFENLTGTTSAETLNGDANANILTGNGGADTLNGNGGNDTLYADSNHSEAINNGASNTDSDDNLYGGSGDDALYASAGDNTLDGGAGADTLVSGTGSDVIVIRSGDGGSSISDADTLADFSDGVDAIGLDSSLGFSDLTIAASGSDTIISAGSEYLMKLLSFSSSNLTYLDFQSTSTDAQTFNGTSGNDFLIGGAGIDTFNGGAGSDTLVGWGGNDIFNIASKSGSYTDTIIGGAGADTLNIAYSGISSLKDFALSSSGSDVAATDSAGGSVTFNGIEALTVNSISYAFAPSTSINSGDGGISNAFYSTSQKTIHSYGSTVWYAQNICSGSHTLGFNCSDDIEYIGSASQETLNLNIQRGGSNYTGDLTIDLKGGNDSINSAKLINTDSIDMGAGDDTVSVMFGADAGGYQTIQNASISKLDGGSGTDTLSFGESANPPSSISLTTAGATNFENLTGTTSAETLNGDANANILTGNGGADTLNGNGGNDTLYADSNHSEAINNGASNTDSDDNLYGGSGDDALYASAGDNTLDGGAGADTLVSGTGSDVIVIRSGDGGSSISDADTLADFSDGVDLIGLSNLQYSDLTVEQGTGSYSSHVVVKKTDTGEFLIVIQNTNLSSIDDYDFSAI